MSDEVDALVEAAMGLTPYQLSAQRRASNPEYRAKHAERMRKLHADPGFRAKNADAIRKRSVDPAWRAKMANVASDPVWRAKNADANKKKASDPVWLANNAEAMKLAKSKPVVQIEHCLVHISTEKCGYNSGNIISVCKGKRHTCGGYHWRYATPEEVAYFWAERERTGTDGPFPLTDCPDSAKIPQEDQ